MIEVEGIAQSFRATRALIGLATRDPETARIAGLLPFFILMFVGNAIVSVGTTPSWLQGFARDQPLSVTISAGRARLEGGPAAHAVWQSIAWSAAMFVFFRGLALHLDRNNVQLRMRAARSVRSDRLRSRPPAISNGTLGHVAASGLGVVCT
jgi:hypothetical protein